jgi:hypothetical protein
MISENDGRTLKDLIFHNWEIEVLLLGCCPIFSHFYGALRIILRPSQKSAGIGSVIPVSRVYGWLLVALSNHLCWNIPFQVLALLCKHLDIFVHWKRDAFRFACDYERFSSLGHSQDLQQWIHVIFRPQRSCSFLSFLGQLLRKSLLWRVAMIVWSICLFSECGTHKRHKKFI